MKHIILIFPILFFLSSCGALVIHSSQCSSDIQLWQVQREDSSIIEVDEFSESKLARSSFIGREDVDLKKEFSKINKNCTEIEKIEVEVEETFGLFNKILLRF